MSIHEPVLLKEVIEALDIKKSGTYLDATLGGASYTLKIAQALEQPSKVLAIDADREAIDRAKELIESLKEKGTRLAPIILVNDNFRNLAEILTSRGVEELDGAVFDLGLSSDQLADRKRSFSFYSDGPLDMSFSQDTKDETRRIINTFKVQELADIFYKFGGEKQAYKLARAIVDRRKEFKFKNTKDLVDLILEHKKSRSKIHPATKVFQALRIATNRELESLEIALEAVLKYLKKGARLAVVSFHSGEDLIVKNFIRKESKNCICPSKAPLCQCNHRASLKNLSKKIILASQEELERNPRARSAKLRIAEKI